MKNRQIIIKIYFVLVLGLILPLSGCTQMSEFERDAFTGLNGGFEVSRNGLPVNWIMYTPNTDKSRHWNVFGGIAIYDTPEKSLMISLQREINDLKDNDHSVDAMDEFIRDLIANINGIYYVTSIDNNLD